MLSESEVRSINADLARPLIIIAAGGTGGHILPARFVAEQLIEKFNCRVEFIGAGKELEDSLLKKFGYQVHVFQAVGIHKRGLKAYFEFILVALKNFFKVLMFIHKKKPAALVGFGAYLSVLPVISAFVLRIPVSIHDAERKIGLANKLLAYFAKTATCAYPETRFPGKVKVVCTGQPIQPAIQEYLNEQGRRGDFPKTPKKILVLGGSQGAKSVDTAILSLANFFKSNNYQLWHQCRVESVAEIKSSYKEAELDAKVEPFIKYPLEAYLWADLVISRSGAGITRELDLLGLPCILIPLPGNASNNHQFQNAQSLEDKGQAVVIQEGGLLAEQLKLALQKFDEEGYYQSRILKDLNHDKTEAASVRIAEVVFGLIS